MPWRLLDLGGGSCGEAPKPANGSVEPWPQAARARAISGAATRVGTDVKGIMTQAFE